LNRLVDQSALATPDVPAYTLNDLLTELSAGIFSELGESRPAADEYRRELHRTFVEQMRRLMSVPTVATGRDAPPRRPADARALARATLVSLDGRLSAAAEDAADPVTSAHFDDLRAVIKEILEPR
jgi:hypothetical protein